ATVETATGALGHGHVVADADAGVVRVGLDRHRALTVTGAGQVLVGPAVHAALVRVGQDLGAGHAAILRALSGVDIEVVGLAGVLGGLVRDGRSTTVAVLTRVAGRHAGVGRGDDAGIRARAVAVSGADRGVDVEGG